MIETTKVPTWLVPALRHTIAVLLALSGPLLMVVSLMLALLAGSPVIGGLGLLGGAILTACGGTGLLWSLGRGKA